VSPLNPLSVSPCDPPDLVGRAVVHDNGITLAIAQLPWVIAGVRARYCVGVVFLLCVFYAHRGRDANKSRDNLLFAGVRVSKCHRKAAPFAMDNDKVVAI
jgi:hypothetical protein